MDHTSVTDRRPDDVESADQRDHQEEEPPTKKLRSSDPDLTVFVGVERKQYDCYSPILASKSGYIDAALAAPMRERESMVMTFEDIEPSDWELLMGIVKPRTWKLLDEKKLLSLLPICDKYDLHEALDCIDEQLSQKAMFDVDPKHVSQPELGPKIEVVSAACGYNLELTKRSGVAFVGKLLDDSDARLGLKVCHIKCLVPVIQRSEQLWKKVRDLCVGIEHEERGRILDSLLFPNLLLTRFRELDHQEIARQVKVVAIEVSGISEELDGIYRCFEGPGGILSYGAHLGFVDDVLCKVGIISKLPLPRPTSWFIYVTEKTLDNDAVELCFECPVHLSDIPPRAGWTPLGEHTGNPILKPIMG